VIAATLCLINFATEGLGGLSLGLFIIPMCRDMGISRGLFGWVTTSRALAGGLSGFFLGRILDRTGPRILIAVSAFITGLSVIGIGAATNTYRLFFFFAIIGLAGLSSPGGSILSTVPVAKWFVRKRGKALAFATAGFTAGAVVFLPVTQLLIDAFGWRRTWFVIAMTSMTLIIPSALVFLRRQPEDMGLHPDGDPEMTAVAEAAGNCALDEPVWTVGEAMRTKVFWLLMFAYVLGGFGMGGTMHRIPYFVELGFNPGLVSICFSTDAIAATLMTLTAGLLLDRFPARFVAAGAFAGFAGAMTVMLFASNAVHMFASVILFGFSVGFYSVGQSYLWANYFGRTFLGTIRGVTIPAVLVASAIGGPAVGYIYDFTGSYKPAWQILIGIFLLAALVMLFAKPPGKASENRLS